MYELATGFPCHRSGRRLYKGRTTCWRTSAMAETRLGAVVRLLYRIADGRRADEPTDGQLLERFAADRDPAAFEALVRRHRPMVRGVCRRALGDRHLAEDAAQATFLILARKAATLDRRPSVANWLYTVAVRIARKAKRTP